MFRLGGAPVRPALVPSHYELAAPVRSSIFRARHYLVAQQRLDGSWAGRKSGDISSLSHLVLLFTYLGRDGSEPVKQAARAILRDQRSDGGWSLAPDGPIDLQASVLAYFALKLAGEDASQPDMSRARQAIRERGGADAADAATRLWLALLGQIDYDHCLPIAPEWLLMAPFMVRLSSTDERRLAALSVVCSLRPQREVELVAWCARAIYRIATRLAARDRRPDASAVSGTRTVYGPVANGLAWCRCASGPSIGQTCCWPIRRWKQRAVTPISTTWPGNGSHSPHSATAKKRLRWLLVKIAWSD